MSRKSPGATSWGRPLNVVPQSSFEPGTSSVVIVKMSVVRPVFELRQTDLRALQVDEHRDGRAEVGGGLAHVGVDLVVHLVGAVTQVHPSDVHARLDDSAEGLVTRRRGPEGRDDLGSSHGVAVLPSVVAVVAVKECGPGRCPAEALKR
jgi:hypothetical protein